MMGSIYHGAVWGHWEDMLDRVTGRLMQLKIPEDFNLSSKFNNMNFIFPSLESYSGISAVKLRFSELLRIHAHLLRRSAMWILYLIYCMQVGLAHLSTK